jgi:hypothetical protein
LPVTERKFSVWARAIPRASAAATIDAGRESHDVGLRESVGGRDGDHTGLAFGESSRLINHEGIDLLERFERSRVLDQNS